MKALKNLIVIILTFVFLNNSQAQEAQNLQIEIEKATGKIALVDKNSNQKLAADYKIQIADIDIYKKDEYVGSLFFENNLLNTNELKVEETLKIAHLQILLIATNKILDFKDTAAILK